jgi:hypothetical protein
MTRRLSSDMTLHVNIIIIIITNTGQQKFGSWLMDAH